ncbi:hypothetical protein Kfla_4939 [Kribbella flavida DSM 17836]|uniref:DUF2269 domain-containing protein n=1 Tax=Kribbella flavida (strain DSM 17836 / JCM 10339 / NBRC 14399) TaxID=479435 RepID=D2Q209_KRIFD|nr:hypothetical protein [Kribbella flavida]ADB33955.1 hypothetical protein Kfla_4939 [Kribbella flavida DSM 17836]
MSTALQIRPRATTPWRLAGRPRKLLLVLHLASVGSWLGIDVTMAVLVFTALGADDPGTRSLCFRALELVAVWPMTISGLTCLVTGVILAYGSKYGLTKYWWVVVKLVLNLLLTTLVLIALRPGVNDMAEQARIQEAGGPAMAPASDLIFPPIVSPTLLMVAVVLSVFKPWGRLRRNR